MKGSDSKLVEPLSPRRQGGRTESQWDHNYNLRAPDSEILKIEWEKPLPELPVAVVLRLAGARGVSR